MSKARLVITAVVLEGRTVSEVANQYGVSRSWIYELRHRYQREGDTAFTPRSKRPKTSPTAISDATINLIQQLRKTLTESGHDAGPSTIAWHLQHHHRTTVSNATISRTLTRLSLVTPEPKKRPKSSYIRFQADQPNQTWQSDFTHYRLTTGRDTEIITWLDDHSRKALHISAHHRTTATITLKTFLKTGEQHGFPASTLTDNGMVYTVRLASGKGGRTKLENELRHRNIKQKNSRPNHPTTCGKVERFQQTLKKWLRAQPNQPSTIAELQTLIDTFTDYYNNKRPHRSLPHRSTPNAAYQARPKATPGTDRTADTHDRIRRDRVDKDGKLTLRINGQLHHIGIGRTHARTRVLMLVHDLNVHIIDAVTGEFIRELTIDTSRNYQPQNPKKTKPK